METASPEKVRFKSNLFGSFGAGLFTAPNTIDFGSVFDNFGAKLLENIHIVATIVVVMLIFIPLVVLCRRKDKKDRLKVSPSHSSIFTKRTASRSVLPTLLF